MVADMAGFCPISIGAPGAPVPPAAQAALGFGCLANLADLATRRTCSFEGCALAALAGTTMPSLSPAQVRAVADAARVHKGSVARYLAGSKQSAPARAAIEIALRRLCLAGHIRPSGAAPAATSVAAS